MEGDIIFVPKIFHQIVSFFFYHQTLSPDLAKLEFPITVNKGTTITTLEKIGRISGPHVHIQLEVDGKLYDPGYVFE